MIANWDRALLETLAAKQPRKSAEMGRSSIRVNAGEALHPRQ